MGEIGLPDSRAIDHPFDGPKKVSVVGRGLDDDGCSLGLRIIHQYIDLVFRKRVNRLRKDQSREWEEESPPFL